MRQSDRQDDRAGSSDDAGAAFRPTRRSLLALAGVTGLTGAANGLPSVLDHDEGTATTRGVQTTATADEDALHLNGDLDLRGHDVENVARIRTATDAAAIATSGSGDGSLELRDAAAETWAMRAREGSSSGPGPIEIQSALHGGSPSADGDDSLTVEGGATIDALSLAGWHVVDVTEAGIQPGSEADLGAFIQRHFNRQVDDESVVYYLPEGTYRWNTRVEAEEFNVFGIVGKPQARVRCTNPEMPYFLRLGLRGASNNDVFLAENITFDIETAGVAASAMIIRVDDYLAINNCTLLGEMDRSFGYVYSINPTLLTRTGRGYVNMAMPDGSFYDPTMAEQEHPMGIGLERDHRGYLVIENSYVEGFINNGIYSSGHTGKVAIRNSTVKNCGSGMLRLGDGDYAYKCRLVNDDAEDRGYSYAALWVKDADTAVADSIKIEARQGTPSELIRINEDVRSCTLTNLTVLSEANQYLFDLTGDGSDAGTVTATNWFIRDRGSADRRAHLGVIRRANTTVENWDVELNPPSGGKRYGFIVDAPWVDVRGCSFTHNGGAEPMVLLDDGADHLRLKDCDFKAGTLYQYSRATVEDAIVADNRFEDGTSLSGDQVGWTVRGPDA